MTPLTFVQLREWIHRECRDSDPIRDTTYKMALTAVVHRLIKYGPDASLNNLDCRDLMNLLLYVNGPVAEWVIRLAFTRSLIEGEEAVTERLMGTTLMAEVRAWYDKLVSSLVGDAADPGEATAWMDAMQGEELSIARLVSARVFPDLAHSSWLHDLPEIPRLQAEMCILLKRIPEYQGLVKNYLAERPWVKWERVDQLS
jgi:hypothetical protein